MDRSKVKLSDEQISDLSRRFYLTGLSSYQETNTDCLQLSVLSYNDNLVDFYFQGILLQHHHYALVLTEGLRAPDTVVSDQATQAADAFRGISHPVVQAPILMADKFIALLKQQETRSDLSLALAYANLQLTRLEFSVASRLLARKISYNYRENTYNAIQASAQARALVKRIEVGLLMYSNPYSALPVMGMKHGELQKIYPDLSEVSIRRVVSVVPYLLCLVHDTSITPSLIDRVVSSFSSLLDPVDFEAKQTLDAQEIVIQPAAKDEWLGLYIKNSTDGARLPTVSDYNWEMREDRIDLERLPKRIVAWNGVKRVLQQSLKLSQEQVEQVLTHWLTDKMIEGYLNTSVLDPCFVHDKHEKESVYMTHFFKKMIYDHLITPNGSRPAHQLILSLMQTYDGKHLLTHSLDVMASAFIKQFREVMKHRLIAMNDGASLERILKNMGESIDKIDCIICDKSMPLSHSKNTRLNDIIDIGLEESERQLEQLNTTFDLRAVAVSRVSSTPNRGKKKTASQSSNKPRSTTKPSEDKADWSSTRSSSFKTSFNGRDTTRPMSYATSMRSSQHTRSSLMSSSKRGASINDTHESTKPDWR